MGSCCAAESRGKFDVVSDTHVIPSAYTEHRPVAESQVPPGTRQFESDAEQPTVKQSPIRMSSRAKSPVSLDPDMYLVRREVDKEV